MDTTVDQLGTVDRVFKNLPAIAPPRVHRKPQKCARRTLPVGERDVVFVQIGEVAHAIGRTTATIRRWERDHDFPRTWEDTGKDHLRRGKRRLYPAPLLPELTRIAHNFDIPDGRLANIDFFWEIQEAFDRYFRSLRSD